MRSWMAQRDALGHRAVVHWPRLDPLGQAGKRGHRLRAGQRGQFARTALKRKSADLLGPWQLWCSGEQVAQWGEVCARRTGGQIELRSRHGVERAIGALGQQCLRPVSSPRARSRRTSACNRCGLPGSAARAPPYDQRASGNIRLRRCLPRRARWPPPHMRRPRTVARPGPRTRVSGIRQSGSLQS